MIRILLLCFAIIPVLGLAICDDSANNANFDSLANRVNSATNTNAIVNGNGNGNANGMSGNMTNSANSGLKNPMRPADTGGPVNGNVDRANTMPPNR